MEEVKYYTYETYTKVIMTSCSGGKSYYKNDGKKGIKRILHREDGPAVENHLYKKWYLNDKLHREDGPAIEWASGRKLYYLNDKPISSKQFKIFKKNEIFKILDL